MGQYLNLAKQQARHSAPMSDALRSMTPSHGGCDVPMSDNRVDFPPIVIEPAMRPDGTPLRPVYWERHGRIIGPGQPEFFFRDSAGQVGLIIRYQDDLVSVADFMLRSRKAFEEQPIAHEVEPVRSF